METSETSLQVTCAIIERDGLVLAAQRSASMSHPLKWEFPGGKIEPGELPAECLRRELLEELGVVVTIVCALTRSEHSYPACSVILHPYICTMENCEVALHEHAAVIWLLPEQLHELDWAEADLPVLRSYLTRNKKNF